MASLKSKKTGFISIVIIAASLLAGCTDYENNWDTVSFRAGDAVYRNSVIQQIDPRPANAYISPVGAGG